MNILHTYEVEIYGKWWFGVFILRLWLNENDYKTFYYLTLWKFSFGIGFPANWFKSNDIHPLIKSEQGLLDYNY